MDRRIVLRAPTAEGGTRRKATFALIAFSFTVFASIDGSGSSLALPSWLLPSSINLHQPREMMSYVTIAVSTIAAIIMTLCIKKILARRRFVEAAIEITPMTVQLMSIYGSAVRTKNNSMTPPNDAHHNITTSTQSPEEYYNNYKGIYCEVRANLPRQQILDVVVMEVVWPHCVWSHVVFRVAKGNIGDLPTDKQRTGERDDVREYATKGNGVLIQQLLKQNHVSIIPAFPKECQGMLTYEQCLHVQAEIERLLDQPIK
jgi:hypothetical protein